MAALFGFGHSLVELVSFLVFALQGRMQLRLPSPRPIERRGLGGNIYDAGYSLLRRE